MNTQVAHARSGDVETSHLAAASVQKSTHLKLVYEQLRRYRRDAELFTREDLADAMRGKMTPQSARSRLKELMEMGYVSVQPTRRKTATGRSQQVLWATFYVEIDPFPDDISYRGYARRKMKDACPESLPTPESLEQD